eukprot:1920178-Rhodomonas_salina.8
MAEITCGNGILDEVSSAIGLRAPLALSGTEIAYAPGGGMRPQGCRGVGSAVCLRARAEMPSADLAFATTARAGCVKAAPSV